ncbi:MAG: hypothetical protein OER90_15125 [Gemmatimonadota bacterium]|nr:hypothetical protein [Gemmatimonadota bacterium]
MLRAVRKLSWVVVAALAIGACGIAGADRVLSIDAVGAVAGVVFLDFDRSRDLNAPDRPMAGVRVGLLLEGSVDTAFTAVSNAQGEFALNAIPVGSYVFVVDRITVGDTVDVVRIDTSQVTLGPDALASVTVAVSFPIVSVASARAETVGKRLFVEGIATTDLGIFGDSTLHLADGTSAIRALRVQPASVVAGDSVRLLGSVGSRNGQPVLEAVTVTLLSSTTTLPPPGGVSTATAATADGARLDAALVRVQAATITDTATVGTNFVLTVDDGSGVLQVVLDGNLGLDTTPFEPTVVIDAVGVLVPTGTGVWQLNPRSVQDLIVR